MSRRLAVRPKPGTEHHAHWFIYREIGSAIGDANPSQKKWSAAMKRGIIRELERKVNAPLLEKMDWAEPYAGPVTYERRGRDA